MKRISYATRKQNMSKIHTSCLIAKTLGLVPGDLVKAYSDRFHLIIMGETPWDNLELDCVTPKYFLYLSSTKHNSFMCTMFLHGDQKILVREVGQNHIKSIYTKVNDW